MGPRMHGGMGARERRAHCLGLAFGLGVCHARLCVWDRHFDHPEFRSRKDGGRYAIDPRTGETSGLGPRIDAQGLSGNKGGKRKGGGTHHKASANGREIKNIARSASHYDRLRPVSRHAVEQGAADAISAIHAIRAGQGGNIKSQISAVVSKYCKSIMGYVERPAPGGGSIRINIADEFAKESKKGIYEPGSMDAPTDPIGRGKAIVFAISKTPEVLEHGAASGTWQGGKTNKAEGKHVHANDQFKTYSQEYEYGGKRVRIVVTVARRRGLEEAEIANVAYWSAMRNLGNGGHDAALVDDLVAVGLGLEFLD